MNNKSWNRGKEGSASDQHVDHLLSAYIANDLDKEARAEVRKHLHSCVDCRAGYVELQATRKLLKSMPMVPPPRAFTVTPEMLGAYAPVKSRPRTFWSSFIAPRNAPRFAFGSVVSLVLTLLVLAGGLLGTGNRAVPSTALLSAPAGASQSKNTGDETSPNARSASDSAAPAPPQSSVAAGAESAPATGTAGPQAGILATPAAGSVTESHVAGLPSPGGLSGSAPPEGPTAAAAAGAAQPSGGAAAASNPQAEDAQTPTSSSYAGAAPVETSLPGAIAGAPQSSPVASAQEPTKQEYRDYTGPPVHSDARTEAAPNNSVPGTSSSSSLPGPVLFVSFGVLFGVLSVLLAVAAVASTRRGL